VAEYLLLLRGGDEVIADYTPSQFQEMMEQFFAWTDHLRAEGRLVVAHELASGGQTVRLRDGAIVVDGPYAETKEIVGGYYLITAADDEEAAAISQGCPILHHGGIVEVRATIVH